MPHLSYATRINRVIDHIDTHLAEPMDLGTLAALAHFSPWHFHRLFQAFTGETLADRVRRRRLETAAARLLATPPQPALTIALDVGFGSAEVFTRAFKAHFSVTPSAWRQGAWQDWTARHRAELSKIHQARHKMHQALADAFLDDAQSWQARHDSSIKGSKMKVEISTLPDTRVAYMRHVGPYGDAGIGQLWARFAAWAGARGPSAQPSPFYGVSQDSPDLTAPDKCRYDACVAVDDGFQAQGEVGAQVIRGGRYACTAFSGTGADIHAAWMRLFAGWLPGSGYQPDDRPCIEAYGETVQVDPATGAFTCQLCLPVRPA